MAANVFVHGYMGWGSFDIPYKAVPYWGMFTGDLLKRLRKQGFECVSASVAPQGSAWDRACELYAQLAGTRTDYGAAHAALFHRNKDVDHYYTELLTLLNELPSKQEMKDTET